MTEEAFINHACSRKIRYRNEKKARNAMKAIGKDGKIVMVRPYKCKYCQGWHLGHPKEDYEKR
jgi:hypothetical protein